MPPRKKRKTGSGSSVATDELAEKYKWRGDPTETFSDWTIEIVTKPKDVNEEEEGATLSEPTKRYHVHKTHLAAGPRKSGYFVKLFQNAAAGNCIESDSSLSRIELDSLQASAFPTLLDYLYAPWEEAKITTQQATALHSLAEYFDLANLRSDAEAFFKNDMSLENVADYYFHAATLHNQDVLDYIQKVIDDNLLEILPSDPIVTMADPSFWAKALKAGKRSKPGRWRATPDWSCHWSKLLLEIGTKSSDSLDKATFDILTHKKMLPVIHKDAAITLCELDDRLKNEEGGDADSEGSPPKFDENSLQARCAAALSTTWQDIDDNACKQLQKRDPKFLANLLNKCLKNTKKDLNQANSSLQRTKQKLEADLAKAKTEMLSAKRKHVSDLARVKDELRHEKVKLEEATGLLSRLRRIPTGGQMISVTGHPPKDLVRFNSHVPDVRETKAGWQKGEKYYVLFYFKD